MKNEKELAKMELKKIKSLIDKPKKPQTAYQIFTQDFKKQQTQKLNGPEMHKACS